MLRDEQSAAVEQVPRSSPAENPESVFEIPPRLRDYGVSRERYLRPILGLNDPVPYSLAGSHHV